jgi:hypothetical protein
MSSEDIQKVKIYDSLVVQPDTRFAVVQGALSYTSTRFSYVTQSASQLTFNCLIPSQNVMVSRSALVTSTAFLQFNAVCADPAVDNALICKIGSDIALAPYPIQQMCSTEQCTVNDTNLSLNVSDVYAELLRMTDRKHNRRVATCPRKLDYYQNYNDQYLTANGSLGGYNSASAVDEVGNGAYGRVTWTLPNGDPIPNGVSSYTYNGVLVNTLNGYPVRKVADIVSTYPLFLSFTSSEPILCSPFIYNEQFDQQVGLFGINSITIVMNMGLAQRCLRNATVGGVTIQNVAFNSTKAFADSSVQLMIATPPLSLPLPKLSRVPAQIIQRYLTPFQTAIPAGATQTLQSQSLVLNAVPDAILVYVKDQAYQTAANSVCDFYLPITKISNLTWDNYSGLMSTYDVNDLYRMTAKSMDIDYNCFRGEAYSDATGQKIALAGSPIVIRPGIDYALPTAQASSLLGSFTFSVEVQVKNQTAGAITPTLFVVPIQSAFLESLAGSSRLVSNILSEADVINAPMDEEQTIGNLGRYVGAGFLDKLQMWAQKARPYISAVKNVLPAEGTAGQIKDILGRVGYGEAGSGRKKFSDRAKL